MKANDVTDTLEMALAATGLDRADVRHRPRLLSDNVSSYVAGDLADWMLEHDMKHIRGAPYHPMTQGKIASQRLRANACRPAETLASDAQEPHPAGALFICPAIWKLRSMRSSATTITIGTTKASATSRPLTSTSGAARPSY